MISYFPAIYPDELVYSWLCRYYVHSGFFSNRSAMQELYCKRSDNPSKEFIGNLNPGAMEQIARMYPLDKLVLEHTMCLQYARFIPLEQKKTALYRLGHDNCDAHYLFCVLPRSEREQYLRSVRCVSKRIGRHTVKYTGIGSIKSETWASARSTGVGLWNPVFQLRVSRVSRSVPLNIA